MRRTSPPPGKIKSANGKGVQCVDGFQAIESEIGKLQLFRPCFAAIDRPGKNPAAPAKESVISAGPARRTISKSDRHDLTKGIKTLDRGADPLTTAVGRISDLACILSRPGIPCIDRVEAMGDAGCIALDPVETALSQRCSLRGQSVATMKTISEDKERHSTEHTESTSAVSVRCDD